MNISIVIPAHNEAAFLKGCLESICIQTLAPQQLIVVSDNSSDNTYKIAQEFAEKHPFINTVNHSSSNIHMPGSKVVQAFNFGLKQLDKDYDILLKLDADILLPKNYLETISDRFSHNPSLGICGGFAYEQDHKGQWLLNHPMDKTHIRGAFKAYSKACFTAMGGLRIAMGWDTVDELLAQYHGFELKTEEHLSVKHLRPIGAAYNKKAKLLQGKAMYGMRYGLLITLIAAFKMAVKQKRFIAFFHHMGGFFEAKKENAPFMVNHEEGVFIRRLRWKNMRSKILG
ncbi:MAG: glycosyltransferase family 2 protein [Bacteroidetes bacterium]|nr:glycosyltransferase family 2 protein [Bacteroidota bacterium]